MIKCIRFKNFFSFKENTIFLKERNIIVGINGAGKTNFIKSLQLLKSTVTEGALSDLLINKWGGFDAMCYADNQKESSVVELEFQFDENVLGQYGYHFQEPVYYLITFKKVGSTQNYSIYESFYTKNEGNPAYRYLKMHNGKGFAREGLSSNQTTVNYELENTSESLLCQLVDKDRYFQIYTLREAIKDIAIYNYFDTTMQSPIRKPMLPGGTSRLMSDGSNLPQILNKIKINSKSDYLKIVSSLQSVNPQYNGFDFNIVGNNIELMLDEKWLDRAVHVTHISDGTLRYLCILAIIHNSQRGALVCIDEPELGLHPDMIGEIIDSIKQNNEKTQFIISTHSEHILDGVPVSDILVCEKDGLNTTVVQSFTNKEYVEWASQYSTGKLWRNGDLGGNRY